MASFELSRTDINQAREFLRGFLQSTNPEGDYRPGTALHDLVIKSFALIFAYLEEEVRTTRKLQSITEILSVPEDSPLFPVDVTEAVDALMSNWFLERKDGTRINGTVGVRFSARSASTTIRRGHRFYLEGDQIFLASTDHTFFYDPAIGLDDYRTIQVGSSTLYEVSVAVESEDEGSENVILEEGEGTVFTFDPINPFAVNAVQVGEFVGGSDVETNEEFVERAKDAITKRDLSTFKSIPTLLKNQFSIVDDVEVVGYGDPEMQRDRIEELPCPVEPAGPIPAERVTTDMVLYLPFNERIGRNYPQEITDKWVFSQVHMYEGVYDEFLVLTKQDGFTNGTAPWVPGHINNALTIKANQTVEISYSDQLIQGNPFIYPTENNFTVMFWVKGRPVGDNDEACIVHTTGIGGVSNASYSIKVTKDGYITFSLTTVLGTQTATSEFGDLDTKTIPTVDEEGFAWVVATYIGDAMNLYVNNILQDNTEQEGNLVGFGGFVVGGSYDPENALTFDGIIDDLIVYAVGKNDLQLNQIYEEKGPGWPHTVLVDQSGIETVASRVGLVFDEYFHVGGRVDIYGDTPLQFSKFDIDPNVVKKTDSPEGANTWVYTFIAEPVYRISYVSSIAVTPIYEFSEDGAGTQGIIPLGPPEPGVELMTFKIDVEDPMMLNSNRQVMTMTLSTDGETDLGSDFIKKSFSYDSIIGMEAIESYVYNRENRIVCGDLLVKGFYPLYVSMDVEYQLEEGVVSLDETAAKHTLADYIQSLRPGEVLEASDLIAILYSQYGIGHITLSLELRGRLYLPDYRSITFASFDRLPVPDIENYIVIDPVIEKLVSQRTARYVAPIGDITMTLRSE